MNEFGDYEDTGRRIMNLLVDNVGNDVIKSYFHGIPDTIMDSQLPCIIVHKSDGNARSGATGTDVVTEVFIISVSLNKLADQRQPGNGPIIDTVSRQLYTIVEGRDRSGFYNPGTIMHTLRTNMTISGAGIDNNIDITYTAPMETEESTVVSAEITITVQEMILVPDRN